MTSFDHDDVARVPARERGPIGAMTRVGIVIGVVVAIGAGIIAAALWGSDALWSSVVASVVTMGFFILGMVGMRFIMYGAPGLSLAGAFVIYLGQIVVLVAVLLGLSRLAWVHGQAFTVSAIAQTLAWQVGVVVGFLRARVLVVEPVSR